MMPNELLDDYWAICLENETTEANAAMLTDAGESNGLNGYSFGVKQFDLKTNDEAADVLANVLQAAVGVPGSPVTQADVDRIRDGDLAHTVEEVDDSSDLTALRERASAGLSLPEAAEPLRNRTREEMGKDIDRVQAQIDGLDDAVGAKAFLSQGAFGRLFLLDYENLFGATIEKFGDFCAGKVVGLICDDDDVCLNHVQAQAPFGIGDIIEYLRNTKQASYADETGLPDLLRRLSTVLKVARNRDAAPIPLQAKDKTYLLSVLAPILGASDDTPIGKNREDGLYSELEDLVSRASA